MISYKYDISADYDKTLSPKVVERYTTVVVVEVCHRPPTDRGDKGLQWNGGVIFQYTYEWREYFPTRPLRFVPVETSPPPLILHILKGPTCSWSYLLCIAGDVLDLHEYLLGTVVLGVSARGSKPNQTKDFKLQFDILYFRAATL